MSDGDLDLVRRIYDEWERGEYASTWWMDSEIEWSAPEAGNSGRGRESLGRYWLDILRSYDDLRTIVEDFLVLETGIVALITFEGQGRGSGIDLRELRGANLLEVEGEQVRRFVIWTNRQTALRELGIDESEA